MYAEGSSVLCTLIWMPPYLHSPLRPWMHLLWNITHRPSRRAVYPSHMEHRTRPMQVGGDYHHGYKWVVPSYLWRQPRGPGHRPDALLSRGKSL